MKSVRKLTQQDILNLQDLVDVTLRDLYPHSKFAGAAIHYDKGRPKTIQVWNYSIEEWADYDLAEMLATCDYAPGFLRFLAKPWGTRL